MESRILSGIRPSSRLHIGNYLGAIKQWIELQHRGRSFFMIADLHAITTPYDPKELPSAINDVALDYLAAGLDPHKATLFVQSHVPEHVELAWLFSTLIPVGELNRMTQYKEKGEDKTKANLGLLAYPVLMAADILIYKANEVPVGEDQVQHVELARIIARKFNNKFGQLFPEPKPLLTTGKRVMSLQDPTKKMSKSDGGGIQLDDEPGVIAKKLSKAVTASKGGDGNPGVMNLFSLMKEFSDQTTYRQYLNAEQTGTIKYSELKVQLAEDIARHFAAFRKKRAELKSNNRYLDEILSAGAKEARDVAKQTLREAKGLMGLN
ncbi:MAG: tryptophan--tRNA ligase [Candidatus Kerfeldbacteria bacterium]|nr:tryptophan--tRNA ligase [Candidatus Kerfeldbacteria bacterium]